MQNDPAFLSRRLEIQGMKKGGGGIGILPRRSYLSEHVPDTAALMYTILFTATCTLISGVHGIFRNRPTWVPPWYTLLGP